MKEIDEIKAIALSTVSGGPSILAKVRARMQVDH